MDAPDIQTQNTPIPGAVDFGSGDPAAQGPPQQQTAPASAAQPQAAQPQAAQAQVTAPAVPPVSATSKNPHMHNFISRVLGAFAGDAPKTYSADPATGKLIASAPVDTNTDKIRRITQHALIGLSASGGPQQKSGLANALTGMGAGAGAVQKQMSEADKAAQGKAKEEFETSQQVTLRKHEIARQNALEFSSYIANRKALNDMDPIFQEGNQFLKTIQASPDLAPHVHEMTDAQLHQAYSTDNTFTHTHIVKPLGWQPATDPATGKEVRDSDGNIVSHMTFAVMDGTQDGKIIISPQWAADFAKYGKMAGIPNAESIKAGDEYEWGSLLPLHNKVDEQKKIVLDGELNREYAWQTDAKGKQVPISINNRLPVGDSDRIKTLDYVPAKLLDEKASVALKEAEAANQRAQARNANLFGPTPVDPLAAANYKAPDNLLTQSSADLRKYLTDNKQPVPANFETLYAVAHYDQDPKTFTKTLRKGMPQMTEDAAIQYIRRYLNPQYQDTNYDAVKKMKTEFADLSKGPGANLLAFNTATGHLGQLWLAAEALHNKDTQALNKIANAYGVAVGKSPVATFNAVKAALSGEIGKTFKGGAADIPERESIEKTLSADMSPAQLANSIHAYAHLMLTKAKQTGLAYHGYTGEWPPNTITPDAQAIYKDMGINTSDVITGPPIRGSQPGSQGSQNGQPQLPPGVPQGATHIGKDANGNVVGYVLNGQWVTAGGKQ